MTTMLVTRPLPDALETAARLEALDIRPVIFPLLRHVTLPTSLPSPAGFAALALTSTAALRALEERRVLERYRDLPVFAVGNRTAAEARARGFGRAESAGGTFADLVALLAGAGLDGPVFYPAARHQSGDLAHALAPHGIMVVTSRVYEMATVDRFSGEVAAALGDGSIDAVLFYSRRTAGAFVACAGAAHLSRAVRARLGALCIAESVAEPLVAAQFVRIGLADHPDEEAMMALALSFARDQNAT